MPENKFSPPYYGGVYSPEITELPEAGFDIEMMKKSGFNVVKIGDNGWNIVEKSKGVFDFSFYNIPDVEKFNDLGSSALNSNSLASCQKYLPQSVFVIKYFPFLYLIAYPVDPNLVV